MVDKQLNVLVCLFVSVHTVNIKAAFHQEAGPGEVLGFQHSLIRLHTSLWSHYSTGLLKDQAQVAFGFLEFSASCCSFMY